MFALAGRAAAAKDRHYALCEMRRTALPAHPIGSHVKIRERADWRDDDDSPGYTAEMAAAQGTYGMVVGGCVEHDHVLVVCATPTSAPTEWLFRVADVEAAPFHSVPDVLASTANLLKVNGWHAGAPFDEGTANFEVMREWNRAVIYRKALALFAERLGAARQASTAE